MIHFNFKVSDIDAENIMSCITEEINRCQVEIIDIMGNDKDAYKIPWYEARVLYLKKLAGKMHNTRIDDENN